MTAMLFPARRSHKGEFVSSGLEQWRAHGAARNSGGLAKSETCSIAQDLKGRRVFHRLESDFPAAGWQRAGIYPQRKWLSKPWRNFLGWSRFRLSEVPGWIDSNDRARWCVRIWLVDRRDARQHGSRQFDEVI
jgi:hypothetical protein